MIDQIKKFAQGVQAPSVDDVALPEFEAGQTEIQSILTIVFGVAAAIAVLVIVLAGFNIVTGGDDPDKISRSKKTIILALVGLGIAVSAEIIVLTILNRI